MKQYVWTTAALGCLVALCTIAEGKTLVKRQTHDVIDPTLQEVDSNDQYRDKRKVDAKFGVKNAVLGFVFNKINSFIDHKTAWVSQLDKTNIAKNRAHGIEPPADPVVSLSGIISGVIGSKLQAAGPLITTVTNKLSSGSSSGGNTGFNIGSLLGGFSGGSGGGDAHATPQLGASVSAYGAI